METTQLSSLFKSDLYVAPSIKVFVETVTIKVLLIKFSLTKHVLVKLTVSESLNKVVNKRQIQKESSWFDSDRQLL